MLAKLYGKLLVYCLSCQLLLLRAERKNGTYSYLFRDQGKDFRLAGVAGLQELFLLMVKDIENWGDGSVPKVPVSGVEFEYQNLC